jgi:hypothetical protein
MLKEPFWDEPEETEASGDKEGVNEVGHKRASQD